MKLYIKYMVSIRCKMIVKEELKKLGLHYVSISLGEVDIMENMDDSQYHQLKHALLKWGLEVMDNKKSMLIEKIKNVIIEMVHYADEFPKINFSEYLSSKLDYDYKYLSNLFSETEGTTIEHFIILHKTERIKEYLFYDELSLTEISYRLNYSSVSHLCKQFKKVTGLTPFYFKQLKLKRNSNLENL